jgi:hypothetical protein
VKANINSVEVHPYTLLNNGHPMDGALGFTNMVVTSVGLEWTFEHISLVLIFNTFF